VAAVARSSGWLAVGLELARGNAVDHAARAIRFSFGTSQAVAPTSTAAAAAVPAPAHRARPSAVRPAPTELPTVPHLGGVLGSDVTRERPWELVKLVVLGMVGAANAVLLALRWRIARLQGR